MPHQNRRLLLILGGVALGVCLTVGAVGAWVASLGMIRIDVHEHGRRGSRVQVCVPSALVLAGLSVARCSGALDDARALENRERKIVRSLLREIRDLPDGDVVRVEGRDQLVLIEKRNRDLLIRALDDGESVSLQIPIQTARRIAESI